MKTIKSFIKLAAVTAAVVSMSSCLTSCDALVDLALSEPCYDTYHVVEVDHYHPRHYYGSSYYGNHYYGNTYTTTRSTTSTVSFGRR